MGISLFRVLLGVRRGKAGGICMRFSGVAMNSSSLGNIDGM